jgi:glycerol kinase
VKKKQYILAIDQGTSSTKTLIIDDAGLVMARASAPLQTNYLADGFVEQDPEAIYQSVCNSVAVCLQQFKQTSGDEQMIIACGISNQRETFIVWDQLGKPLYNAVVWQCRRSLAICERLIESGLQARIKASTGLPVDPYFSGTKLIWLYENNIEVKKAIDEGQAYFGTVDTWLLYKLTKGKSYVTDYTNASRTLFFNLITLSWDIELLQIFGLSKINLPVCAASAFSFGSTNFDGLLQNPIPISALIGDAHAAAFGEGCLTPGSAKATMGTGCSVFMNTGEQLTVDSGDLVTTICFSTANQVFYALEGVIVSCGATMEWLKQSMGLFTDAAETAAMASAVTDNNGVYLVPAFSGLGAPHWDMHRKATISGLSFSANRNHLVRAALESIPYQVMDVVLAMEKITHVQLQQLMVDGGLSANEFVLQFLASLLGKPVANIGLADVSALGAAYLAALQNGIFTSLQQVAGLNKIEKIYHPQKDDQMLTAYAGWSAAVAIGKTVHK